MAAMAAMTNVREKIGYQIAQQFLVAVA